MRFTRKFIALWRRQSIAQIRRHFRQGSLEEPTWFSPKIPSKPDEVIQSFFSQNFETLCKFSSLFSVRSGLPPNSEDFYPSFHDIFALNSMEFWYWIRSSVQGRFTRGSISIRRRHLPPKFGLILPEVSCLWRRHAIQTYFTHGSITPFTTKFGHIWPEVSCLFGAAIYHRNSDIFDGWPKVSCLFGTAIRTYFTRGSICHQIQTYLTRFTWSFKAFWRRHFRPKFHGCLAPPTSDAFYGSTWGSMAMCAHFPSLYY